MRRFSASIVAGLLALSVTACTEDSPGTTSGPAVQELTTAPATASAAPGESRTVDAAGDILQMRVGPLVRTGSAVVLTVPTRLERAASGGSAVVSRHFSTSSATSFDAARLVDEVGGRVFLTSDTVDGRGCACTDRLRVETGETQPLQAVFGGVPADVHQVSVMLPYAGVFTDVPIVAGQAPGPIDPSSAAPAFSAPLDAVTERLDVALQTRRSKERVDLSLATDVLFKLDSADLTPAAGRSIAAAVTDLRAAGAGALTVTGHTDSTGTTAHNQALSQRRARAVADALAVRLPEAQWPKRVVAAGEGQPVVPNDSAAHRALNRRVTVTYPTRAAAAAAAPARTVLPPTTGRTGRAADGVEVMLSLGRGTVRFVPGPAVRRGSYLLVSLTARNTGDRKATILDFLGQSVFTVRDEFDPYARYGAAGVRLLAGDTAAYGLDYAIQAGGHRCLCDRMLNRSIPPGGEQVLSLWFPAPPTGTATVTLDVPDRLRITDLPVA